MKKNKNEPRLEEYALRITRWIGSAQSLLVHTGIFTLTILLLVSRIFPFDAIILVFNTAVSLEAIYLALFIQMTVNYTTETIESVEEDIDEIQEDIDEIQVDVDELQEDVEEMSEEDKQEAQRKADQRRTLEQLRADLARLIADVDRLQRPS